MLLSIYIKKLDETFTRETDQFPQVTKDYLTRNGFSQRVRDVHASIKREDYAEGAAGTEAWQADVRAAVQNALEQMDSGDVPSERGVIDPKIAAARKFAAKLSPEALAQAEAVVEKAMSPEELAAAMAYIDRQRAKAGQSHTGKAA
jgi:hypothetical protein